LRAVAMAWSSGLCLAILARAGVPWTYIALPPTLRPRQIAAIRRCRFARGTSTMDMTGREVIFEFRKVGGSVKVSSIEVATQVGIAVVMPAGASEAAMRAQAVRRLAFVLERRQRELTQRR